MCSNWFYFFETIDDFGEGQSDGDSGSSGGSGGGDAPDEPSWRRGKASMDKQTVLCIIIDSGIFNVDGMYMQSFTSN